jgi:hypothetical protein
LLTSISELICDRQAGRCVCWTGSACEPSPSASGQDPRGV